MGTRHIGFETEKPCPNGCMVRVVRKFDGTYGCSECGETFEDV